MDHISSGIRSLLNFSIAYNFFLKFVGYDKALQELVNTHIKPFQNAKILDIGCGTSMILNYLPSHIDYHGFDMNEKYINKSRKKFSNNKNYKFINARVSKNTITDLGAYDIAIAISILHHLNDNEANYLFQNAYLALKPGGRLVTYDPIKLPNQTWFIKTFNMLDRGKNIRDLDQYKSLIRQFQNVNWYIRDDMGWTIPGVAVILECAK